MSEPMTMIQQQKLDLIGKLQAVAATDTAEATAMAEEWQAQLGFVRRTAEVLTADAAAKAGTQQQLAAIAEEVRSGKL